jgi:hypothetical protein
MWPAAPRLPLQDVTVLSFGGGQDSTRLLLGILCDPSYRARWVQGHLVVVMAATGDEHAETNIHVRFCAELCAWAGVEFYHVTPEMGFHTGIWQGLIEAYRARTMIGSKAYPKTCTDRLKIQPIYGFLEAWLERRMGIEGGRKKGFYRFRDAGFRLRVLIGIAAGEEARIGEGASGPLWMQRTVEKIYPLIEEGEDRAACQAVITALGYPVPLPSNCQRCPFLSHVELLWLYRFYRAAYEEWVALEAAKLAKWADKGEQNLGVFGRRTLPEALTKAQELYGAWSDEQLWTYKMSHGHCVASRY